MASKVPKRISNEEFEEYIRNGLTLNVPSDQGIQNPTEFAKVSNSESNIMKGKPTCNIDTDNVTEPDEVTGEPENMNNHLIFERDLRYFQYYGDLFGVDIQYNWKPGFAFCFIMFLFAVILIQLGYTQYVHIKNENYYRILETLALYGIIISMVLKVLVFLKDYKSIKALLVAIIKVIKQNDNGCRGAKIRSRLHYNTRFYISTAIGVMVALSFFFAYPAKAFFVDHLWVSLLPIQYMYVNETTATGFITANVISSAYGILGNFAIVYSVLMFVSVILSYTMFVDVFEEDVKYLDEMWSGGTDASVACKHAFLKNLCRKQQDMNDYVGEIKRFLDDYIYHYFIASYLGQIICMFQIIVSDWKSGYAVTYGMFMEMMFYCLMGTKISSENERVLDILQQSNWYSYDLYSQKIFLLLWMASTNANEMWIGPLAPLSVLTGTNVVKSIYSYYNILVELV